MLSAARTRDLGIAGSAGVDVYDAAPPRGDCVTVCVVICPACGEPARRLIVRVALAEQCGHGMWPGGPSDSQFGSAVRPRGARAAPM